MPADFLLCCALYLFRFGVTMHPFALYLAMIYLGDDAEWSEGEENFTNMDVVMVPTICTLCWQHCAETGGTTPCGDMVEAVSPAAAPWTMSADNVVGFIPQAVPTNNLSSLVVI